MIRGARPPAPTDAPLPRINRPRGDTGPVDAETARPTRRRRRGGYRPPSVRRRPPRLRTRTHRRGGGYPVGLVELAARLMGCTNLAGVVHLCSGSVRAARTFDLRPQSSCAAVADVRRLPVRSGAVDWVMVDPPYGPDYAQALWGLGKQYPTPAVILREVARILAPGGAVAFLHHVVPQLPDELERIGTWGVTTGPNYRIRALTIARRRALRLELGDN